MKRNMWYKQRQIQKVIDLYYLKYKSCFHRLSKKRTKKIKNIKSILSKKKPGEKNGKGKKKPNVNKNRAKKTNMSHRKPVRKKTKKEKKN